MRIGAARNTTETANPRLCIGYRSFPSRSTGLLPVFDGCESFRLGQNVAGSLNLIPTSSLPRTIAEFYRYETKDFGPARSHRLWASGQNGFTIGLGDLKRRGSPSNRQRVHGRMPIAK